MTDEAKVPLHLSQSRHQLGFTEAASPSNAAMLVTEAIAEKARPMKATYITYLDASKCFDIVDHNSMLTHMFDQGVQGKTWQLFNNLYSDITSQVKWKGELSNAFKEGQGIRQGGKSSTSCFKSRGNNTLCKITVYQTG